MPTTLQISLAPSDWRLAQHILPHQIAVLGGQVDEILLVIDVRKSPGRFGAEWEAGVSRIQTLCRGVTRARVVEVDYSPSARDAVSNAYFGGRAIPDKDFRGGPFYSYFFALHAAAHDTVFHVDADILFGGGSSQWVSEAVQVLQQNRAIGFVSPLPGPPTADGTLRQEASAAILSGHPGYLFAGMSTRLFVCDRRRLQDKLGPLPLLRPPWRVAAGAFLRRQPIYALPETILSRAMVSKSVQRFDFLGEPPGCWSLHPPYRTELFYERLPELIRRVETGDVPDAQRGDYDLNDSLIDWSEARARLARRKWWKVLLRRLGGGS